METNWKDLGETKKRRPPINGVKRKRDGGKSSHAGKKMQKNKT